MQSVFVSYSTADQRDAVSICKEIERRDVPCWISSRDVKPGENYQEAIVQAIRDARALVLVFSANANHSDEIKKELSLASRYHIPVIALRIADVEPADAFAYELSTRQWIDVFADRKGSIDKLVVRIDHLDPSAGAIAPAIGAIKPRSGSFGWGAKAALAVAVLALLAGLYTWLPRQASSPAVKSMQVRLASFDRLSPDLPANLSNAVRDEIVGAFNDAGVVKVSTASAPAPGNAPAYALGGSIRRDGDTIRVITHLTNERSGTTLWSNTFNYRAGALARVPRKVAVDAGATMRCGLFGASTYPGLLPDSVLTDYFQACFHFGQVDFQPTKALDAARLVVAAVPDFSWGWSAVEIAVARSLEVTPPPQRAALREEAISAAETALKLDPTNSEALAWKTLVIDPGNMVGREALFQRALKARTLYCGCEHALYGDFLSELGRSGAAQSEYQRAVDMLALEVVPQARLGLAYLMSGQSQEGEKHIAAAIELADDSSLRASLTMLKALHSHDYKSAEAELSRADVLTPQIRRAWLAALRALVTGAPAAQAAAVPGLVALGDSDGEAETTTAFLGALGANREALHLVEALVSANEYGARSWLFSPEMAGARADPAFAEVAERVGLMRYWRASKTRPDTCAGPHQASFCKAI